MSKKEINIPIINENLIEYLDRLFPDKCADLNDSERVIIYKSGQR